MANYEKNNLAYDKVGSYAHQMEVHRKKDLGFDKLVSIIESKMETCFSAYNDSKTGINSISIFAPAIPITDEQREVLKSYISDRYSISKGNLKFKKCLFSKRYKISLVI